MLPLFGDDAAEPGEGHMGRRDQGALARRALEEAGAHRLRRRLAAHHSERS